MKEKLMELEKSGNHVFHGSPTGDMEILEPRQGRHVVDTKNPESQILDGRPAVSATPHAELAIFRAIINGKNVPFSHNSGFGTRNGEKEFRVSSKEVLDAVKGSKGHVYVFDKKEFEPYDRDRKPAEDTMEWRSYTPVKPIEVVEVTSDDLPHADRIKIGE
jgi:hypothetical protein